ncbi:GNAT family N-acetyltransferase [Mycetocola spongiae]|uniref:GNAT family N-acetyltransferase n=1 Tax=Mycetocola spongiae TaxID=2859226 RepID=UPI001CF58CB4|nr:GNAT family N-acetyltransferase [Mycetocola spongiae]
MIIRPVKSGEFFAWYGLYEQYAEFYGTALGDEHAVRVWGWIDRGEHAMRALVAENASGELVGLAHVRGFARPLAGELGLYLDDLFVAPAARSAGVATALIEEASRLASAEGAGVLRWVTAPDNTVARRLYDRLATATEWVTYDRAVAGA